MSRRHRRTRRLPIARPFSALVGVAALATAAVGAADISGDELASVAAPALSAPVGQPAAVQHADARRARVVEASRDYTRTSLAVSPAVQADVTQGAQLRERVLSRLDDAAAQRSDEIEQAIARQRRIERRNRWVLPVSGEITATFGEGGGMWESTHTGLDFGAAEGEPVASAAAGEVTSTGYDGSYGNKVVVTHDDGTQTWYCHLSSISVSPGESVDAGSTIGAVGSTGNTTGAHLHLEVHPGGGGPVDPYSVLESEGAV